MCHILSWWFAAQGAEQFQHHLPDTHTPPGERGAGMTLSISMIYWQRSPQAGVQTLVPAELLRGAAREQRGTVGIPSTA